MNLFATNETTRDPLDLERLAEELAERELGTTNASLSGTDHDLPVYVPLSHDNPYLSAELFNVEEFLLSRAYTSHTFFSFINMR